MQVVDVPVQLGHRASNRLRNSKAPLVPWEPFFCVLLQDDNTFTEYRSEEMAVFPGKLRRPSIKKQMVDSSFYDLPRVRLDGGSKAFRRRWGYEMSPPPPLPEEDDEMEEEPYPLPDLLETEVAEDEISLGETRSLREDYFFGFCKDTSYEKACGSDRRGSAPSTPILGGRLGSVQEPSSNRFVNFFNKRSFKNNPLKRTKSVTKLERSKRSAVGPLHFGGFSMGGGTEGSSECGGYRSPSCTQDMMGNLSRLRSSRSHESLLCSQQQQMMRTLDLGAGEVTIKPLHSSVLGQDHCFQISSPSGTRYYSCRNAVERDKWVESLRRAVNPFMDKMRRTENSLKIFVMEAKGVGAKKRYFCEILLDNCLFARTSSKPKGDICFWGEQFEFKSLPTVETIAVTLFREAEKKRKKDKSVLVGRVYIPVTSVTSRTLMERWYPVNLPSGTKGSPKDSPSLRIKCKFQSVDVMPLETYHNFLQYLKENYWELCQVLEPVVSVKAKEDIGTTLVHIMQREGLAKDFLADLVMMEIERIDDSHLLFRGNSLATKAMEAFMKLVGEKYLLDTLSHVINKIVEEDLNCEVDPTKVTHTADLQKNQENLNRVVWMTWNCVLNSHTFFPSGLRQCFSLYRERLEASGKGKLSDNLISASIFLRFLCPAILSPSLFNITQEYPDERTSRNLTLIAKTLQTLANFTLFQGKEYFMEFMNSFIEKEQAQMRKFLKLISSPTANDLRPVEYDGDIDIGVQLSILHTLLSEALQKISTNKKLLSSNPELNRHAEKLNTLLGDITARSKQPNVNIVQHISGSTADIIVNTQQTAFQEGSESEYQSLKDNIFRFNDPTVKLAQCEKKSANQFSAVMGMTDKDHSTSRSSTLPRNSYLTGYERKPMVEIHAAGDCVHFAALENENKPTRGPHPIGHSFSHSHLASGAPKPSSLFSHHHHFHNHAGWYNNKGVYGEQPFNNYVPRPHGNHPASTKAHMDSSDALPQDRGRQSPTEGDVNMKGSQTSISQLSNIASSGYQSFAYSQSSSPVDPSISHDAANNNSQNPHHLQNGSVTSHHNHIQFSSPQVNSPLAFNNPMYHLNSVTSCQRIAPSSGAQGHVHSHQCNSHLQYTNQSHNSPISSSLSSAHSIEDLSLRTGGPDSNFSKVGSFQVPNSSSSDDSASLTQTPPEHRYHFKSGAPRTNPRCAPPLWVHNHSALPPDHHHSTSDLLGSHCRRTKASRRQSAEIASARRLQRHYDSDSSSDEQQRMVSHRQRPSRPHLRVSETKTLDEYEQEILTLRNAMEEMHLKLLAAEERLHVHSSSGDKQSSTLDLRDSDWSQDHSVNISHSNKHSVSVKCQPGPDSNLQAATLTIPVNGNIDLETTGLQMKDLLQNRTSSRPGWVHSMDKPSIRLMLVQEELKKEQKKMAELMNEKDVVIQQQRERIDCLDRANTQLLLALKHTKSLDQPEECCQTESSHLVENNVSNLSDTSDYKSSSC